VKRRRKKPMRARSKTNSYRKRERFVPYMLAVKSLPCAALIVPGHVCEGPIEADHAGPRGTGQKAHDGTCIPLCTRAHRERTDFSGAFKSWDQAMMRDFLFGRIMQTRRYLEARGVLVPRMTVEEAKAVLAMKSTAFASTPTVSVDCRFAEDLREDGNVDVRHPEAIEGNRR